MFYLMCHYDKAVLYYNSMLFTLFLCHCPYTEGTVHAFSSGMIMSGYIQPELSSNIYAYQTTISIFVQVSRIN